MAEMRRVACSSPTVRGPLLSAQNTSIRLGWVNAVQRRNTNSTAPASRLNAERSGFTSSCPPSERDFTRYSTRRLTRRTESRPRASMARRDWLATGSARFRRRATEETVCGASCDKSAKIFRRVRLASTRQVRQRVGCEEVGWLMYHTLQSVILLSRPNGKATDMRKPGFAFAMAATRFNSAGTGRWAPCCGFADALSKTASHSSHSRETDLGIRVPLPVRSLLCLRPIPV